ncbi:hypothetical protein N8I84_14815 [Streptomyces cynarae]|jgi:hypothetical protein|uniref:Uncharacterized protein n=1 Tax=Streptomyces cynarae TaxID=2981134 RepID=A0ABY6E719_9ACTN|nr:hypothetical protein [Streptomyces cynarae]UXY19858.1 hypothetical protein N8I84_14815 [Streptomyces cynarae]
MATRVRKFHVAGTAARLARHLLDADVEQLVRFSCVGDEVTLDIPDTHFHVHLRESGDSFQLQFRMTHDGPAKPRSWSRRLPVSDGLPGIARCIAGDVRTMARELAPLTAAAGV